MLNEDGCYFIGRKQIIELTMFETKILSLLLNNKGKIITYEQICKERYHQDEDLYYRKCIIAGMSRLRKKIKNEVNIKVKWGIGYRID